MILMNIRVTCGRIKFKIKQRLSFNTLKRTIYAIKMLDLKFDSFKKVIFKPKVLQVMTLSKNNVYSEKLLKEIAALKYVHNYSVFLHNEDYSQNSVNCKRSINEYYLKLLNGGQRDDKK